MLGVHKLSLSADNPHQPDVDREDQQGGCGNKESGSQECLKQTGDVGHNGAFGIASAFSCAGQKTDSLFNIVEWVRLLLVFRASLLDFCGCITGTLPEVVLDHDGQLARLAVIGSFVLPRVARVHDFVGHART
jgi:hypothetical protein